MKNIAYVTVDADGHILMRYSVPTDSFPIENKEGVYLVTDGSSILPRGMVQFDVSKLSKGINIIKSYDDYTLKAKKPSKKSLLSEAQMDALDILDKKFAIHYTGVVGPLYLIHQEKKRQAELEGPQELVVNDADREAILANAAAESAKIAELEQTRMALKTALKTAKTIDEVQTILKTIEDHNV